jgi:hypothetical protein
MRKISKLTAVFLALVIMSNGVLAAQMTASMVDISTQVKSVGEKPPCHSDKSASDEEAMECCQGDCTGCVLSTNLPYLLIVDLPNLSVADKTVHMSNFLLPAHSASLYRPPILI